MTNFGDSELDRSAPSRKTALLMAKRRLVQCSL